MLRTRRWLAWLPLLFALALAVGCASQTRQYAKELNPVIGRADKAYFVEKYGEPDKRSAIDASTDWWEYTFAGESLNDYASRGNLTTSTVLRLTFKNGVLASWQSSNQVR